MPISGSAGSVITESSQISDNIITNDHLNDDIITDAEMAANVLGANIVIIPRMFTTVTQGTWADLSDATTWAQQILSNDAADADGDGLEYKVYLAQGTYSLTVQYNEDNQEAIIDCFIDAAEVASFDLFAASGANDIKQTATGIVVATSGVKDFKFVVDGRNGSNTTGFRVIVSAFVLEKTA